MCYLSLAKPDSAVEVLEKMVRNLTQLRAVFHQYPAVQMEPLEFEYGCISALRSLDMDLMEDLVTHHTWRGIVVASFLVSLKPDPRYGPLLLSARDKVDINRWLVDIALCQVNQEDCCLHPQHQQLLTEAGTRLADVQGMPARIRRAPTAEQRLEMEKEAEAVRAAYRARGADAALEVLQRSPWHKHFR